MSNVLISIYRDNCYPKKYLESSSKIATSKIETLEEARIIF